MQSLAPKQAETALELIPFHQSGPVLLGGSRYKGAATRTALHAYTGAAVARYGPGALVRQAGVAVPRRVSAVMGVLQTALPRTHLILQALLPRGMDLLPFLRFRWPNRGTAALAEVNAKYQVRLTEQHLP